MIDSRPAAAIVNHMCLGGIFAWSMFNEPVRSIFVFSCEIVAYAMHFVCGDFFGGTDHAAYGRAGAGRVGLVALAGILLLSGN